MRNFVIALVATITLAGVLFIVQDPSFQFALLLLAVFGLFNAYLESLDRIQELRETIEKISDYLS